MFALAVIVLFIGSRIMLPFSFYLPPDFDAGFLESKREFFYSSGYFVGFYAHILASPIALVCGLAQTSQTVREVFPQFHRAVGRVYVTLVLVFAAPGGLVMSTVAGGGWSGKVCFSVISLLTWGFTFVGWRHSRAKRYARHGRWMIRSYVMMCSAVLLRINHVLLEPTSLDAQLKYQLSAWLSFVPSMILVEFLLGRKVILGLPPKAQKGTS